MSDGMASGDSFSSPVNSDKPVGRTRLEYWRMYGFVFDHPNWLANFGWVTLAVVSQIAIPIVGIVVAYGYVYEIAESLIRAPKNKFADFTFDRFGPYLSRGLWLILAAIIVSLPLFVVVTVLAVVVAIAAALVAEAGEETAVMFFTAFAAIGFLLFLMAAILINLYSLPLMLQVGLAQNLSFQEGFCWRRIRRFVRLMWWESICGILFLMVTSFFLSLAGILCFFVGVYVVQAWTIFAAVHLQYQLYEIYLVRGGEPFPIKDSTPAYHGTVTAQVVDGKN